jgi:hypothetical protein
MSRWQDYAGLGDHRYAARDRERFPGLEPDAERMRFRDSYAEEWDEDEAAESGRVLLDGIPARWRVCDTCNGRGKHANPDIDAHGLTSEDFDEDPDFADDYFRGAYDVPCYGCGGRTTVLVPDGDSMTQAQRDELRRRLQEEAAHYAEVLAERRMGA